MRTLAILIALSALPITASSIGDSGGGCPPSPLPALVITATPAELAAGLDAQARANLQQARPPAQPAPGVLARLLGKARPPAQAAPAAPSAGDIAAERRALINRALCGEGQEVLLLDLAVAAGHIENVELLLASGAAADGAGAQASDRDTVFSRCVDLKRTQAFYHLRESRPMVDPQRRLAAYRLLIARGADVNKLTRRGSGPLLRCPDAAVVRLLLEAGARTDATRWDPVDTWTYNAVTSGSMPSAEQSLGVLRVLADWPGTDRRLTQRTERAVCAMCSGTESPEVCAQLRALVQPRDARIFESRGYTTRSLERAMRCSALTQPDCAECAWHKYVDSNGEPLVPGQPAPGAPSVAR